MLAVFDAGHDLSLRCAITLQLICNDYSWDVLQTLQQLAEELLGRFFVASALDQDVKDDAILIHGSPQIKPVA